MRVRWSTPARLDLRRQARYIAMDNPVAARQAASRVRETAQILATFPLQGRPGRVIDTRELVVPRTPFILVYRVREQIVEIVAVVHHAQQWPERFE